MAKQSSPSKETLDSILDQSYVDIIELHQKYLAEAQEILQRLQKSKPKKTVPNNNWMKSFAELGRLVVGLVKEGRQLEKEREADDLSDAELINEFTPILIAAGWKPPEGQ